MAESRAHHDAAPASMPQPSLAERARTLVHLGRTGSLATLSARHADWPFGSVMPYGLDDQGRPTFLMSAMAMHTQNLLRDARASLLITQAEASQDPLAVGRVTFMGEALRAPQDDIASLRGAYLERHPEAEMWVDFGDFAWYRMDIKEIYLVAGFGVMGWIAAADYERAEADPLADIAASILDHMNADHADALAMLARQDGQGQVDSASMTAVDRWGFHLSVASKGEAQERRVSFPQEVRNATEARQVLARMTQQARAAQT